MKIEVLDIIYFKNFKLILNSIDIYNEEDTFVNTATVTIE
jgi:hypothetical protein